VKINGAKPEKLSDAFGVLKTVVVTPDDVEMIRSYPSKRRRFMDIVISITSKRYLVELSRYQAILRQRNVLLKDRSTDGSSVEAWDPQLAEHAAEIAIRRRGFIEGFSSCYGETHRKLAGGNESRLSYETSPREIGTALGKEGKETIRGLYEEHFRRSYSRDRELGTTVIGPHRDDIMIELRERQIKPYGSQGQQRTSVFALRIAEARYIEERTGERPLLLMDDVFSQLDRERGERLMKLVYGEYQAIITTPREEDTNYAPQEMEKLQVSEGKICPL
jgi:DNA replication and repair protein RecF